MAVIALAAGTLAASARADGDPASDYLLVQKVFVPYEGASAPTQQHELTKLVAAPP